MLDFGKMLTLDQWLAIAGLLVAVIGIFLAYLFYIKSKKEPLPWFSIHPLRVHIVDTAQANVEGLEIRHNGALLSDKNITATTIFIGNRGTAPIRAEDVLEPLVIGLSEGSEILDARIIQVSRPLCDFKLTKVQDSDRHFGIWFKITETNDVAKIQIIHRGDPDARIDAAGTFVGCKLLHRDYNAIAQPAVGWRFLMPLTILTFALSGVLVIDPHYFQGWIWPGWGKIAILVLDVPVFILVFTFIDHKIIRRFGSRRSRVELLASDVRSRKDSSTHRSTM